jgi:threonine synthase
LIRARRLGATLGLRRLYVKDEGQNPTGSCMARGFAVAMTRALHGGARVVSVATPGHGAAGAAAYAARAALSAQVFLPKDARALFALEAERHGAAVTRVDGDLSQAEALAEGQSREQGWYEMSSLREPYRIEGAKTVGYELAEQLGWEVPDWIICPVGSGIGFVGVWKAFTEMASLGWLDPVRRPHMVAVQAAGCAPVVRAVAAGADRAEAWDAASVRTMADDLRVTDSPGAMLVLRAIKESDGTACGVGDAEMVAEMKTLARQEGVSAAPGGGATLQALRVLVGEGRVKPHDTVVLVNPSTATAWLG